MAYTIEEKKYLGAFYTPDILAETLARIVLSIVKRDKNKLYIALDPATGDSILLRALSAHCFKKKMSLSVVGVDVDESAIKLSQQNWRNLKQDSTFICTDALYPFEMQTPKQGWEYLIHKYIPNGIDFIVSNPPWGANKDKYVNLQQDFFTAKGQFDIYDLFIESSIRCLNENGYYGFIVPDSIYEQEHKPIRELLLKETCVKRIIRLGEGFFDDVNIAVSLIFGVKKKSRNYNVRCSHLSSESRKQVLSGSQDLMHAINECEHCIPVKTMIQSGYVFLTDIEPSDIRILKMLSKLPKLGEFAESHRGIELSKKGIVYFCDKCNKWFPKPRKKATETVKCPNCGNLKVAREYKSEGIITDRKNSESLSLITGEDIYRYTTKAKSYIKQNYNGINYKNPSLYNGTKVLIRKTGVGITAGIDYSNSATNQVVYIIKCRNGINNHITNEVILSMINSRIMTYYIIKTKGSNGWKTHPYLSQTDIENLPFPVIDLSDDNIVNALDEISEMVKRGVCHSSTNISKGIDAMIEKKVADLYGLRIEDYRVIYDALNKVQEMIPFKRLLTIKIEDIFKNGL